MKNTKTQTDKHEVLSMSFWESFTNKIKGLFGVKGIQNVDSVDDVTSVGVKARESASHQPSHNGYEVSSGTSKSKENLPRGEEETHEFSDNGYDKRNSNLIMSYDGSVEDVAPQSWENTRRRPHRNGVPSDSDLVSRIMYNAVNGTTTIDTKRGNTHQVLDDGSTFADIENAGSKGRWSVANVGY